jgi:hypothetical protein
MACRGRASDDLFGVGLALMCCVAIVLEGYETYYCSLRPTATTFLCRCRTFRSTVHLQAVCKRQKRGCSVPTGRASDL